MKTYEKVCKDIVDIVKLVDDIEINQNTQDPMISLYRALDNTILIRNTLNSIEITKEYCEILISIEDTLDVFKRNQTPPLHTESIGKALKLMVRHIRPWNYIK